MIDTKHKKFLKKLFPGEDALFAPEETAVFAADASRAKGKVLAVVRPTATDQAAELLAWAEREKMPLYFRARGTNVVGAAVPARDGVVVSTLKMNKILEVSHDDFVAVVQPGVVTSDLQAALAPKKLIYPPDPASVKISTIGGNAATGAGGMSAVKYGVTRDFILAIQAILPGGRVINTGGRVHKNVMGLDLTRLMVGSEGTLAFFSELTLKLLPMPEARASLMAGFPDMAKAIDAARDVFRAGRLPMAMEFMPRGVLTAISKITSAPWNDATGAVLLFRLDGSPPAVAEDLERLTAIARNNAADPLISASTPEAEEELWELRRMINPALFQLAPDKIADDVAVPRGCLRRALEGMERIAGQQGIPIIGFGHLGDGNIHVDIMYDASNEREAAAAVRAKEAVFRLVLSLGGTLTGEHGVGLTKAPYVSWQLGDTELGLMREIKNAFDPSGILNPGKWY